MIEILPLAKVRPDPANVRRNVGDVTGLAESITKVGLLEHLVVRPAGDGTFLVVCGHRRLLACGVAGMAEVPCDVRSELSERDVVEMMLTENVARDDLHPLDEALAYRKLVELGASQRELEQIVGRSQSHVSKRVALLDLPKLVQDKIGADKGGITLAQAAELHKLAHVPHHAEAAYRTWAAHPQTNLEALVRGHLADAAGEAKRSEALKGLTASGVTVIEVEWFDTYRQPYRQIGKGWDKIPLNLRAHRKLDCHAAVVDKHGSVYQVCTKPANHPEARATGGAGRRGHDSGTPEAAATKKAERAKVRERNKQLKIAGAARAAFMKGLVALADAATPAAAHAVLQRTRGFDRYSSRDLTLVAAELLDLNPDVRTEVVDALVDYAEAGIAAAGRVTLALAFAEAEWRIRKDYGWGGTVVAAHFSYLEREGYKPTTAEKESLKAASR